MRWLALAFLLWSLPAEGRERARHSDDVTVTTTLAQRLAARSVISSAQATNIEEAHDLNALVDDLDFAGSATFVDRNIKIEHHEATKTAPAFDSTTYLGRPFVLDAIPKSPQTTRLSRSEAKTLVKWLVPNPKAPWDAAFARVLVVLVDDVVDALAVKPAAAVAKK
jgi:hypothetical protein